MGRDEEAAAHFERSTEVGGAGGEAESNLALLTQERDSERAVKLLERALDLGEERAKEHLARLRL